MTSVIALTIEFILLYLFRLGGYIVPDYTYSIMVFLFTFAFMFDLAKSKHLADVRAALLFGYFWRIALVYWDIYASYIYLLPNSGHDSNMFYRASVIYARTGDSGQGQFFSQIMGSIFRIVGNSKLYGQVLIALSSVLALCVFARILGELHLNVRVKKWTVLLLAFLPNYAILSSLFLRESFVCLLLTLSVYCFYLWFTRGSLLGFAVSFALTVFAARLHSGVIAACIGYIMVFLLYDRKRNIFRASAQTLIPSILLGILMLYLYINFGDSLFTKMNNVDSIEDIANTSELGGSSYARYVGNSSTPLNMIIFTLPRLFYFLFSPFPWQWRGIADIIAFLFSGLFYLLAIIRAVKYIRSDDGDFKQLLIALLIVATAITFVFSWGVSNTGTASRHRDKMIILFGLIYAISLEPRRAPSVIVFRR